MTKPPTSSGTQSMPPAHPGPGAEASHDAHHLHEFGDIENVVHVARQSDADADAHKDPVSPIHVKTKLARQHRWTRLRANLFRERHLMQYFHNDTLYRARELRKVSREELFLDLVIVAAIAALGHELRAGPIVWDSVEKFIVLFAAVYSAWRSVVLLWNFFGVKEDILEKAGIYVSFVSIIGIALGAHEAFYDGVRPYVSISAFIATLIPAASLSILGSTEKLLKNPANRVNQMYVTTFISILNVAPYFAVAFVGTKKATRILYWVAFGLQAFSLYFSNLLFRFLHRNAKGHTRLAVNIELMVEKFEVLTMIVLGESVIGILFEAGAVISKEGARIGMMYLSAIGTTAIIYSMQTYYIQIDGPILKGGTHAIRHKAQAGLLWSTLHMPYHLCLILFATGIGFALRDIVVPPKLETASKLVVDALVHAGDSATSTVGKEQQFTRSARWVYTIGWGGSLIFPGIFAALHHGGVRAATKRLRLAARAPIVIGLMVGMPFADLSAGKFQAVFVVVTALMSLTEFVLVHMDRIGFFRSEGSTTLGSSSVDSGGGLKTSDDGDLFLTDGSDEEDQTASGSGEQGADLEAGPAATAAENDVIAEQLRARLCKGHCTRMEIVRPKGRKKKAAAAPADKDGTGDGGDEPSKEDTSLA